MADSAGEAALFELPPQQQSAPELPTSAQGWPENPVARVLLETSVPHLDREFDYLVPQDLDEAAQPGVKIKVKFGHQMHTAWLVERAPTALTGAKLSPVRSVVSALPVLRPEILDLCRTVARRYAGTVADVLRTAVPARVARVEKQYAQAAENDSDEDLRAIRQPKAPEAFFDWSLFDGATEFLNQAHSNPDTATTVASEATSEPGATDTDLHSQSEPDPDTRVVNTRKGQKAALVLPSSYGDLDPMRMIADAVAQTAAAGRGAVAVVADVRQLDRLCTILDSLVGRAAYSRLTGHNGPTARYRDYLSVATGRRLISVGTRSAIWAPVDHLALICVWDDADSSHSDPRAPYPHVREVALLRSEASGCNVLFAATSRSVDLQRMVESGFITELPVSRARHHSLVPRVISTADSFNMQRDPLATRARLPHLAWKTARESLEGTKHPSGPVLLQVARAGFIPGLVCENCRSTARCSQCAGPLMFADQRSIQTGETTCRWCGRRHRSFSCLECGCPRLRAGARGVDRTAEELGRAFPQTAIKSSSADHMLTTVDSAPALVVATPGAEPIVSEGYAAALLLDGDTQLSREKIRVPERVLSNWMRAASLVRPGSQGGVVVVTANQQDVVGALVRMNPISFASRQYQERAGIPLPPAVRCADVRGSLRAVRRFIDTAELPYHSDSSPWVGPAVIEEATGTDPAEYRALLFFPYSVGEAVTSALRAAKAIMSARHKDDSVRLQVDPLDAI